jgi:hypothetical protein
MISFLLNLFLHFRSKTPAELHPLKVPHYVPKIHAKKNQNVQNKSFKRAVFLQDVFLR